MRITIEVRRGKTAWAKGKKRTFYARKYLMRTLVAASIALVLMGLPLFPRILVPSDWEVDPQEFRVPVVDLAAFWFWNGDMQPEEMERELRAMKEASVHGVVSHPRFGMGGEFDRSELEYYLSETYFDRFKFGLEVCRRFCLKVILSDRHNLPSGYGGGRVLKGGKVGTRQVEPNPEFIAKHLAMEELTIGAEGRRENSWKIPDGKLVAVIATQAQRDKLVRSTFRNLPSQLSEGTLKWSAQESAWRLMFFMQRDTRPEVEPGTAGQKNPCCADL